MILAIDTTSSAASVALINEHELVGEYTSNAKLTHLQKLMPMIEHLLNNCEVSFSDIQSIAVSQGPGSFTGIRIGVSAAKALAQVKEIPLIGVPTLKAMAYHFSSYNHIVCPILDARRHQVYSAAYTWKENKCSEILQPKAYDLDPLLEALIKFKSEIMFLGDGVKVYKEKIISKLGDTAKFAQPYLSMQKASSVAQLGLEMSKEKQFQSCYEMRPDYLRKSEAERNLEKR